MATPAKSLSTKPPDDAERRSNEALIRELRDQGTFETPLETQTREEVIGSLRKIANKFVAEVARQKEPRNAVLIRDARAFIFTYGSYRLGVYGPGSDIDSVCIAPNYVTYNEFFALFPRLLLKMTGPGEVKDLSTVDSAAVPIIKFEYRGISIDLIFSAIQSLKQLPMNKSWNLADVNLLRGMSNEMSRSLSGPRVADEILRCVPEEHTFKLALRAVKLWAKRRGLYGAMYGWPGGVAWAIMVARICIYYPKANSAMIVKRLFMVMLKWAWPDPIRLVDKIQDAGLGLNSWNPQVSQVETPVYPSVLGLTWNSFIPVTGGMSCL
jgi:poly(A) polymerase